MNKVASDVKELNQCEFLGEQGRKAGYNLTMLERRAENTDIKLQKIS